MRLDRILLALLLVAAPAIIGQAADAPTKKLVLLAQAPDGHPAATHEYVAGLKLLAKLLADVPGLEVSLLHADEPWSEGPEKLRQADGAVIFLSTGAHWIQAEPRRLDALAALAARGGGLSTLHWGMGTKKANEVPAFVKLLGGCHGGPDRRYKFLEAAVEARCPEPAHPIVAGIEPFMVRDEFYYQLKFVQPAGSVVPLVQVPIDGKTETVSWAWERPDGGRSFGFSGLHFHENWRLGQYRRLVTQGVLWTMKLPIPAGGLPVKVSAEDLELPR